ncbi:MAG TPA: conjugal transfer protein TraH, partial [Waddliaceae bacterium]
ILVLFPLIAKADLHDEMNKFFDRAGASVNVNSGEVYQGQKAGYMTGGGITVRGRVMNTRPLSVNLPGFDAGCGGIDIFNGGFTFINHQQLIETLKSIGSSAFGYAFLLGLKTVSPQVSGVIENLQTWSNHINALNINSCETAQVAVGSVWPKRTMASQEVCRRLGRDTGRVTDYVSARHGCAIEKTNKEITNAESGSRGFWKEEVNVAWECIQKQTYLSQDKELAEFFMSLMGTIIFRKENKNGKSETIGEIKPSKISDESFLQTLIEGGKTTIYKCNDLKTDKYCLVVKEIEIEFSSSNSWLGRIRNQLIEIQEKILADTELSADEQALLAKSRLPLYKIINVLTAYKKGTCPVDLYHVSEIVAMDLLMQFLREAIEIVREGAVQFKNEKIYGGSEIDDYIEELKHVERKVSYYETRSMQLFEREFLIIQKIQLIEEQLRTELFLY